MRNPDVVPIIRPTLPAFELVEDDLRAVWASGILTCGLNVRALEAAFAQRCGTDDAVMMNSCTSGLILLLQALDLPAQGEVMVPAFTFAATAHAVVWRGLTPVFADCDAADLTLDPDSVRQRVSDRTVAIMATTIFGTPPDIDALQAVADEAGVPLILDSAQALGSRWRGRPMGGFGAGEVFSMSPTKVATAGEAGVITTNDPALAGRLRRLRDYGKSTDGMDMEYIGLSARPSEFHAVVGRACLGTLDDCIGRRLEHIKRYQEALADLPGLSFPSVPAGRESSGNYMVVRIAGDVAPLSRDRLYDALGAARIQCKKYFYPAVHQQTAYRPLHGDRGPLPEAERAAAECLALPLFAHMEEADLVPVSATVRAAFLDA